MPTSYHGQISSIMEIILNEKPETIIDIGIGFGKYGVLCREFLDISLQRYKKADWKCKIHGIEGFKKYKNPIHTYVYDKIFYGLIEEEIDRITDVYDLGLMIDVLEHFDKGTGKHLVNKILDICKKLIISVPAIPEDQSYLDNELETHKSIWTSSDFQSYDVKKVEIIPMTLYNSSIIALIEGCENR